MPRKPTKKGLTRRLDTLWSLEVRKRAGGICEWCGKRVATQAHHAVGRGNRRLRWNSANGVAVDGGCHLYIEAHPFEFTEWFKEHRPEDYDYLSRPESKAPIMRSLPDLQDLIETFKQAA
jgi:hypothetical protein